MKVRRDINSIPARSAADTWKTVTDLITGKGSQHRTDLDMIAGVIGSIITDEHPAKEPFILSGVGSRLVIYCAYGSDAVTGDENIDALSWNPTAGDWRLRVPCDKENMAWVKAALANKSARITVYDVDAPEVDEDVKAAATAEVIEIDWTAGGTR